jgi:hypothetical protein
MAVVVAGEEVYLAADDGDVVPTVRRADRP